MRGLKRDLWKAGIAIAGLLLMAWIPVSMASAQVRASGVAATATVTVQATPTEDATVTALNKEQLALQVKQLQNQLQNQNNWLANNSTALIAAVTTLLVALFGIYQWAGNRRDARQQEIDAQDKELKDRKAEREKRAEERFQFVAEALGSKDRERQVGAAIMLRTFLQPGYEQFYQQTFDLAVVHLQMRKANQQDAVSPIPMDVLSQALIIVFQEAFPRARRWVEKQLASESKKFDPRILNASNILLDNAYLSQADFASGWLSYASFQNADLSGADLSGANLTWANLVEADLSKANLNGAYLFDANLNGANLSEANLEGAELYGVKGLTKEQLEACKAQGAIIDEDATTSSPRPTVAPSPSSQSNDAQTPSTPLAQGSTPTPETGESSAPSSKPGPQS